MYLEGKFKVKKEDITEMNKILLLLCSILGNELRHGSKFQVHGSKLKEKRIQGF